MKKNFFKITIGLLALAVLVLIIIYLSQGDQKDIKPISVSPPESEEKFANEEVQSIAKVPPKTENRELISQNGTQQSQINFTLTLPNKTYKVSVPEGSSLYESMKILAMNQDAKFRFNAKDYGSLGYFIDEINEVVGSPGKYWVYYVNDKSATLGASKYIIKPGDIVEWKQEGI